MRSEERMFAKDASRVWWLLLLTGILWLLISFIVLRFNYTSVAAVGFLIGAVFLAAGVNEFMMGTAVQGGWRWFHFILGGVFLVGSAWSFFEPFNTFYALASVLGLLLVIMGSFEITRSIVSKPENELWWLGLIVGILEILLAFWVSQQYFPARAELILLWVGFMAMFRGFSQIGLAFAVRHAGREAEKEAVTA